MWQYQGRDFDPTEYPGTFGFVYLIENLTTGRKYIGKKLLTMAGYKTVNKKRKKIRKESDWRDYYGSSPELQKDVETLGKENFSRTITHLCRSRGECTYLESKEIFLHDAILDDTFYNSWISCKVQRTHVKLLAEELMGGQET